MIVQIHNRCQLGLVLSHKLLALLVLGLQVLHQLYRHLLLTLPVIFHEHCLLADLLLLVIKFQRQLLQLVNIFLIFPNSRHEELGVAAYFLEVFGEVFDFGAHRVSHSLRNLVFAPLNHLLSLAQHIPFLHELSHVMAHFLFNEVDVLLSYFRNCFVVRRLIGLQPEALA